ncbi:MAG: hypothetical protein DME34_08170 [Verrucomicrobia bacterium]|nr:MAG: hypothetical protein DME34_08170 [Verrucomicrobiota bacterium]
MEHAGRDSRDDHQPVFIFLADVAGSRRRKIQRPADAGAAFRRVAARNHHPQDRHRYRHVLFQSGHVDIKTSKDAAQALFPLAGKFAGTLFTLGVVGTGLLAIPTLTGSAAYALAETFAWREGLDQRFRGARPFYLVIIVSTLIGVVMDFLNVNPVRALYWTAVINGLLAPVLLLGILIAVVDPTVMKQQPSSIPSVIVVSFATLLMFVAAIGMFVF